ncbi:MAG: permease [Bacteroidales bacterium]|nr:permease [Bacteroidales bacterium]
MNYFTLYIKELVFLVNEMSPYLLLGFLFAGILHVYLPEHKIYKYLGKQNFMSVTNAALIGVPLPLCSCGVIPTGLSFYKNGASKGSSVSFLISTPQTGVDSIMVTYSLLGLPLAIIRPVIAFITGIFGGVVTNMVEKTDRTKKQVDIESAQTKPKGIIEVLRYAFIEFLSDIVKWLAIGMLLAALISVLVPNDFFAQRINNNYLDMLLILVAAVPLYVCATGSVPIAAILMMKGLSPGAAIVFLMAGPATNIATITLIGKELGRKTLFTYLGSIIIGALFFGFLVNTFLPAQWFTRTLVMTHAEHGAHFIPEWFKYVSSLILGGLIIFALAKMYLRFLFPSKTKLTANTMDIIKIKVEGMSCSHCKATVENSIKALDGITDADADLRTNEVTIHGDDINENRLKKAVEDRGYIFKGKV